MKTIYFFLSVVAVLLDACPSQGGEVPTIMELKQKVRMSTLVCVGRMEDIRVVETNSLKVVRTSDQLKTGEYALKDGEIVRARIAMDQILYSLNGQEHLGQSGSGNIEVVFGASNMSVFKPHGPVVFFLTRTPAALIDANFFADYYPFFGWANLYVSPDELGKVRRLIESFETIQ